jgi:HAD superfamily hydrolase (TIGR01509 family)
VHTNRAIVLDFGNVVAFFSHLQAAKNLANLSETPAKPEEILAFCFGSPLDHAFEKGRIASQEFRATVRNQFRIQAPDPDFDQAFADIFRMNPGVCSHLDQLKKQGQLLLLSNTTPLHSDWFLRQFSRELSLFDHVVLSHEVGHRKPDPEIFAHCERLAGLPPEKMVLVDDLPDNIQGARDRGWQGVLYHPEVDLSQVFTSNSPI